MAGAAGGIAAAGAMEAASGVLSTYLSVHQSKMAQRRAIRAAERMAQNQIQWRAADARAAGLHPLAALGISPGDAATGIPTFDTSGIAQAGQAIGRGIRDYFEQDAQEVLLGTAREKLKQEQIQTRMMERQEEMSKHPVSATLSTLTGTQNALLGSGQFGAGMKFDVNSVSPGAVVVPNEVPAAEKMGLESGARPWNKAYFDSEGNLIQGPGMEGSMMQQANPGTWLGTALRGARRYSRRLYHSAEQLWNKDKSYKFFRKEVEQLPQLPAGWTYVYHPIEGRYQAVRRSSLKPYVRPRARKGKYQLDYVP